MVSPSPTSTSLVLPGHLNIHVSISCFRVAWRCRETYFSLRVSCYCFLSCLPRKLQRLTVDRGQVRTGWEELWQCFSLWLPRIFCSPIKMITSLASGGEFLQGISSFLLFSTAEHLACCWDAFRCLSTVRGHGLSLFSAPWLRDFESPCSAWDPTQQTLCGCPRLHGMRWAPGGQTAEKQSEQTP